MRRYAAAYFASCQIRSPRLRITLPRTTTTPNPFVWTASADTVLTKRAVAVSVRGHSFA
jgi:hypothetical protein